MLTEIEAYGNELRELRACERLDEILSRRGRPRESQRSAEPMGRVRWDERIVHGGGQEALQNLKHEGD